MRRVKKGGPQAQHHAVPIHLREELDQLSLALVLASFDDEGVHLGAVLSQRLHLPRFVIDVLRLKFLVELDLVLRHWPDVFRLLFLRLFAFARRLLHLSRGFRLALQLQQLGTEVQRQLVRGIVSRRQHQAVKQFVD
jgi:hypothetical protein